MHIDDAHDSVSTKTSRSRKTGIVFGHGEMGGLLLPDASVSHNTGSMMVQSDIPQLPACTMYKVEWQILLTLGTQIILANFSVC